MTRGQDIAKGVAIGVAIAGIAALAPWAVVGSGLVALAKQQSRRKAKAVQPASVQRDGEGRLLDWQSVLRGVQRGGISSELRPELWPLLLGVYPPGSSEDEQLAALTQLRKQYTKLVLICQELERQGLEAQRQLVAAAGSNEDGEVAEGYAAAADVPGNVLAFAESHRIIVVDAVRTDFGSDGKGSSAEGERDLPGSSTADSCGGLGSPTITILPVAVMDGIPELVFVDHPAPAPTAAAAPVAGSPAPGPTHPVMNGNTPLWTSRLAAEVLGQASHASVRSQVQMLRLVNLLSAYAVYDPETSYCQGMSDLAAVFIQLFDDDAVAFACFERLMRQARRNFRHDEVGIKQQLRQIAGILEHTDPSLYDHLCQLGAQDCMFAYRMVVVMLRRELPPEFAMTLWEMQWALEASAALEQQQQQGDAQGPASTGASMHSSSSTSALMAAAAVGRSVGSAGSSASSSGGGSSSGRAGVAAPFLGASRSGREEVEDSNFQHWFIAAVIRSHRSKVFQCQDNDDVLRLFARAEVDFWGVLESAERSYRRFSHGSEAMDRLLLLSP